jgi:hypothetical protein
VQRGIIPSAMGMMAVDRHTRIKYTIVMPVDNKITTHNRRGK